MPQLVKGGKWVFGWTIVSSAGEVRIPPEAYAEYGFQSGEQVVFLPGSRRSGGCSVARREMLAGSQISRAQRMLGEGWVGENERVAFPSMAGFQTGERLLVVRGSGLALGFVQRGPIYEEALRHAEIEVFSI
ncbi:MAG: hypothetical protein JW963_23400 [Anaerolineales bacterium]|nr:hypothetical protein [Anaerolineales bacterium]